MTQFMTPFQWVGITVMTILIGIIKAIPDAGTTTKPDDDAVGLLSDESTL
jgi:hypothetical protein